MITLYKTKTCAYCRMVAKFLDRYKVEYQEIYLDDKPKLRQSLIEKTGISTVPITTDGERYLAGYNPGQLKELIREA